MEVHGGCFRDGLGSMPGVETTAAAALYFWTLVAFGLLWWGGLPTFWACKFRFVRDRVLAPSPAMWHSAWALFFEIKCAFCGRCFRSTPLRGSSFPLLPLPRG